MITINDRGMQIKDITGKAIEVTDLKKAIKQCKIGLNSPFKMESGHTIGENYNFLLEQLENIRNNKK